MRTGNTFHMKAENDETTSALFSQLAGILGVGKRSDGRYHLADIATAGSIQKFARFKGFRYDSENFSYDPKNSAPGNARRESARAEVHHGFTNEALYFKAGFSTEPHAVYEYLKPRGRAYGEPFRLRDFDGYNHEAVSPLFLDFPKDLYIDYVNGVSIIANSTGKTGYDPATCVTLGEILKAPDDMYVALYIFYTGSMQWLLPTNVKVNDLSASTFPNILFAYSESELPSGVSGNIYPYVIPELADREDEELLLIAVGVQNLTYQTDKIPLSVGSPTKPIGDRWLFSMEIEKNADRKTIVAIMGKVLTGLKGTLTANLGYATKRSTINGRQTYVLNNVSSSLKLVTPSEWLFTQQDPIYIQVNITNAYGVMYKLDGTQVNGIEQQYTMYMYGANQTFTLDSVLNTLMNYQFDDWSNGSQLAFNVSIYARKYQNSTQGQVTILSAKTYYVSKP